MVHTRPRSLSVRLGSSSGLRIPLKDMQVPLEPMGSPDIFRQKKEIPHTKEEPTYIYTSLVFVTAWRTSPARVTHGRCLRQLPEKEGGHLLNFSPWEPATRLIRMQKSVPDEREGGN